MKKIKCLVVGDGNVGKTSLLISYCTGRFPEGTTPTKFEKYEAKVKVNDKNIQLVFIDTSGNGDYDKLRQASYPDVDVILICFSVDSKSSFNSLKHRWIPETQQYCPNAVTVLVGTKKDIRNKSTDLLNMMSDDESEFIFDDRGRSLAKEFNAEYVECSAQTKEGLDSVFEVATMLVLNRHSGNSCQLL